MKLNNKLILLIILIIFHINLTENKKISIGINNNFIINNKSKSHSELVTLDCGSLGNCRECSSNVNCNWCETSSSCIVSGGTCAACARNNPLQCPIGIESCENFKDCRSCSFNILCGWCTGNNTCVDIDSYGDICLGTTCLGCMVETPIQCPSQNQTCSSFNTPRSCASQQRCGWCTSSNTCMDINQYGNLCSEQCVGCVKIGSSLAPYGDTFCSNYTNCRECSSQPRCGFCTSTNTCMDVDQYGNLCSPEQCQGCVLENPNLCSEKFNFCSNYTNPRDCSSQPRCAFCTSSNTCLDVDQYGNLCSPEQCQGCLISSPLISSTGLTFCSNYTTPRECSSQPRCAFCTSSNTCFDVDQYGNLCSPDQCQGCLISSPLVSSAGLNFCSNYTTPRECSSQPRCGFCTSSNTCMDVNQYGNLCSPDQCEGCIVGTSMVAPEGNNFCGNFTTPRDCASQQRCGWCTEPGYCVDVNVYGDICEPEICSGCVVTDPQDTPPLEKPFCSDYSNCRECASEQRCTWCTSSMSCTDADQYGNLCFGSCVGCLHNNPLTCPSGTTTCEDHTSCRDCSENVQCSWCTSTQSCMDSDVYGNICEPESCIGCSYSSTKDCPKGNLECSDLTDCSACASQPKCAYCNATKACLDYNEGVCNPESCFDSAIFTSSSDCPVTFINLKDTDEI